MTSSSGKKASRKTRPSPSESATLFDVDTRKKGNDGHDWIVIETKQGVKRWARALYSDNDATFLENYVEDPDPKFGYYTRKYLRKAHKDLQKVGVYLLFDKTCVPGLYCGSGSVLSELLEKHFPDDSHDNKKILFGCSQHAIEYFVQKKMPQKFFLYHTIYGKSAKWNRVRGEIKDILQTHFKVEWSASTKKAIVVHIPQEVLKQDYAYFKKMRKRWEAAFLS